MARSLGLKTVVEGIEDDETWRTVAELGCDYGQGYHLARPMSEANLIEWLADRHQADSLSVFGPI